MTHLRIVNVLGASCPVSVILSDCNKNINVQRISVKKIPKYEILGKSFRWESKYFMCTGGADMTRLSVAVGKALCERSADSLAWQGAWCSMAGTAQ
jgi:hypothetical protein